MPDFAALLTEGTARVGGDMDTGSNISYPSLFLESDRASLRAQNAYLRLSGAQISVMVSSSLCGTLAGGCPCIIGTFWP